MGKPTGFLDHDRQYPAKRPVTERIEDYREIEQPLTAPELETQASRCMDCGIPFCHMNGCPVYNRIPDFNDLVYKGKWREALDILHATNNFPEFTGRVCPAPCETSCTLAINIPAVAIRQIELQLVERGFAEGWIKPFSHDQTTGKKVAVIGSGPSGLAAAQQLARAGHEVTVFEKSDRLGGLLRYGIPDFKLEKPIIDRRLEQMRQEGVYFETGVEAGKDISVQYLQRTFSAIVIAAGAGVPRDLKVPRRELSGIHFAMDYLTLQNQANSGDNIPFDKRISAKDKAVVVVGGGDTGSDCIGTARRQGARSITQLEIMPKPPETRNLYNPWPLWPLVMRTSSSHEEGCDRRWGILTKEFIGENGRVKKILCVNVEWSLNDKSLPVNYQELPGTEFELDADLVLLAMGFLHVEPKPLLESFKIKTDNRGNIVTDASGMTNVAGVFAGGDAVSGASLVVRAIYQGRQVAESVNAYLLRS